MMFSLRNLRYTRSLSIAALLSILAVSSAPALADIMISPTRAVLDDNNRQTTIILRNPGTVERAYRLSWSERRMDARGNMVKLKEGENRQSAANLVRFSPKRVVVGPGQLQTVRLNYRPIQNLQPGEYRSHLVIGLEPQQSGTKVMEDQQQGISVQLNALISFGLPVFVRHGPGKANINIVAVTPDKLNSGPTPSPALRIEMTRSGEFGSFGRIVVYQQLDANAPVVEIGRASNVAIYAESDRSNKLVELDNKAKLSPGSWIRVVYEGEGAEMGRVFAEKTFQIGK